MLRVISTFFVSLLIYVYSYSQSNNDIIIQDSSGYIIDDFLKIKLGNNEKLKRKGVKAYSLFGLNFSANQYLLNVSVKRQTACADLDSGRWKLFNEKYALYVIKDTGNLVRDFLLILVKKYFDREIRLGLKYNYDMLKLKTEQIFNEKGIIKKSSTDYIIFSFRKDKTYDKDLPFLPNFLLYHKGKIYCFEVIKEGKGFGRIYRFLSQKIYIKKENDYKSFYPSNLGITIYEFQQFYKNLMCQDY